MMDTIEMALSGLFWTIIAVWRTLPLFVVVLLLTVLLRKRIPAQYQCWLWILVVARLLLPFSVGSPLAMSPNLDLTNNGVFSNESRDYQGELETFTYRNNDGRIVIVNGPVVPIDATVEERRAAEAKVSILEATSVDLDTSAAVVDDTGYEVLLTIAVYALPWMWVAGFGFFACRGVIAYGRFAWRLRGSTCIEDQAIVDRLLRACDRIGVGRRPRIKQVEELDAPAVFGLFRPVLCLPSCWREQLSNDEIELVFMHELAHVRRRDALMLSVAGMARAIHWFHPLSWIACAKLQSSVEQAADAVATRDLTQSRITQYGELLLRFAGENLGSRRSAVVGLLAMASSQGLRSRIEALAAVKPRRRWLVRICLIPTIGLLAYSGLTDADTLEPEFHPPHRVPDIQSILAEADIPTVSQYLADANDFSSAREIQVNVAAALRKVTELQPDIDAEHFVISYFAYRKIGKATITDGVLCTLATPQLEALLKQRLEAFEQSGLWQVVVDMRVIETDIRLLNQFDWFGSDPQTLCQRIETTPRLDEQEAWPTLFAIDAPSGQAVPTLTSGLSQSPSTPVLAIKVSRVDSERLLHRCQRDQRSNVLQSPKVTLFNGQAGTISDLAQRPFVTDVSVIRGELASALQPKISIYEEGWKFRIKTTVTADANQVELQCIFTHSSIGEVRLADLPRIAANQPDGEVTIQVPSVQVDSIAVQSRLAADEVLLVFSPKPYDDEHVPNRKIGQVFMIRTQPIADMDFLQEYTESEKRD